MLTMGSCMIETFIYSPSEGVHKCWGNFPTPYIEQNIVQGRMFSHYILLYPLFSSSLKGAWKMSPSCLFVLMDVLVSKEFSQTLLITTVSVDFHCFHQNTGPVKYLRNYALKLKFKR